MFFNPDLALGPWRDGEAATMFGFESFFNSPVDDVLKEGPHMPADFVEPMAERETNRIGLDPWLKYDVNILNKYYSRNMKKSIFNYHFNMALLNGQGIGAAISIWNGPIEITKENWLKMAEGKKYWYYDWKDNFNGFPGTFMTDRKAFRAASMKKRVKSTVM